MTIVLWGGGGAAPTTSVLSCKPLGRACPDARRRPSSTRIRTRLPSDPCRTDSTWALSRASPRTEQGGGREGETPKPQQNASRASGAPHNRAPSSRPPAAIRNEPARPQPAKSGPQPGCHCAPRNRPPSHPVAIHASTAVHRASCVPRLNTAEQARNSHFSWRPTAAAWRSGGDARRLADNLGVVVRCAPSCPC